MHQFETSEVYGDSVETQQLISNTKDNYMEDLDIELTIVGHETQGKFTDNLPRLGEISYVSTDTIGNFNNKVSTFSTPQSDEINPPNTILLTIMKSNQQEASTGNIYNVLNKQCIRHLTMSTTDPGAAKPDSFAIGSISKRDRSGSGDKAAPVYPVKHPTMSYAGAAKGRPAAQTVDESIYHWYTGGEKQKLKKLCMGGSECKIGCSWDQFGDNASDAVESICRQLFDLRMTMQHDRPSKSTYYIVKDEQAAERLLNGPLFYEGKKIEFFQTVHYEEEVMIITIPSFKDVQGETLFKAACKTLSKYGTVKDASARFVRGTSTMVPFGMKILFAKNSEKDMPNFIKVQKSRVGMFWRGCTPSCNYCK
ncbi:hypothetical protein BB560_006285, partial [Smittium megazygosporum]